MYNFLMRYLFFFCTFILCFGSLATFGKSVHLIQIGAKGDGRVNETDFIQNILNDATVDTVFFDFGYTFLSNNLKMPSNKTLIIDGTIRLDNVHTKDSIQGFLYSINASNISVSGKGVIDGNKKNLKNGYYSLLRFINCSNIHISGITLRNNRLPNPTSSRITLGCLHLIDCNDFFIYNLEVEDWSREGIWLRNSKNGIVRRVNFIGGIDSWSGLQASGESILVDSVNVYNAGASGISFDVNNSELKNSLVVGNRYFHGFNFGHKNIPTENTLILNCMSINAAQNGFNFGFGSKKNVVKNCKALYAKDSGFNTSNGAKDVVYDNVVAKYCKFGMKFFRTKIVVSNSDLRNNEKSYKHVLNESSDASIYDFNNVVLD
jgi:hypothetical protein